MKIKEITIKNFRSIVNQTIKFSNMNIFVGTNDVGKSNVLKALNLFFNNETEVGAEYNFDTDFTKLFNPRSKEAKEITIKLVIEVPSSYKDGGDVVWDKRWRMEGIRTDKEKIYDKKTKSTLSQRSRIPTALRGIKYRYVPAVKSDAFFKELLGTLYDTMSLSLGDSIQKPMKDFSKTLQTETKSLSKDVNEALHLDSILTVPTDLRELFTTLNFDTQTDAKINYSLSYRGDGIKTRHIPIILKYIAEQDMQSRTQGSMRIFTFWGYEEPENSLEMAKCFELAEQFYSYSNDIQMFITTHSPAFYMYGNKKNASLLHVEQKEYDKETTIQQNLNIESIHRDIGIMQLISPFIKEAIENNENSIEDLNRILSEALKENKEYKEIIKNTGIVDIPTIYVEGKTDKIYLEKAIEIHNKRLKEKIDNNAIKIYVHEEFGGVVQVGHWIEAWCRTTNQSKMLALFDCDMAAKKTNRELKNDECVQNRLSKPQTVKIIGLKPNQTIINILSKGILFEFSIEHLFPVWIFEENSNKLIEREACYFKLDTAIKDPNLSYNQVVSNVINDEKVKEYFLLKQISDNKKTQFCNKVMKLNDKHDEIFADFKETVDDIAEFFEISSDGEE